jgi:hypothetical protein
MGDGTAVFHHSDLFSNVLSAAGRVGSGADESSNLGYNDHTSHRFMEVGLLATDFLAGLRARRGW